MIAALTKETEAFRNIIQEAETCLQEICEPNNIDFKKYLKLPNVNSEDSIEYIMEELLRASSNSPYKNNTIRFLERKNEMKEILFDFSPNRILQKYESDYTKLYEILKSKYLNNKIERKNNFWLDFAKTTIDGAKFLSVFNTKKDFDNFVTTLFNTHPDALPLLLHSKIHGFGTALPYDFLKELGYDYAKPDIHIKKIIYSLGFTKTDDEITVVEKLRELCHNTGCSLYSADKLLWLVCTQDFYNEEDKEKNKFTKTSGPQNESNRNNFIQRCIQKGYNLN